MKKIYLLLFCSLFIPNLVNAEPLESLLREVLRRNPALAAARSKWEASRERPKIAGSLPDPMLTYGYFFQNVETRLGATWPVIGTRKSLLMVRMEKAKRAFQ